MRALQFKHCLREYAPRHRMKMWTTGPLLIQSVTLIKLAGYFKIILIQTPASTARMDTLPATLYGKVQLITSKYRKDNLWRASPFISQNEEGLALKTF